MVSSLPSNGLFWSTLIFVMHMSIVLPLRGDSNPSISTIKDQYLSNNASNEGKLLASEILSNGTRTVRPDIIPSSTPAQRDIDIPNNDQRPRPTGNVSSCAFFIHPKKPGYGLALKKKFSLEFNSTAKYRIDCSTEATQCFSLYAIIDDELRLAAKGCVDYKNIPADSCSLPEKRRGISMAVSRKLAKAQQRFSSETYTKIEQKAYLRKECVPGAVKGRDDVWACCCELDDCNDEIHSVPDLKILKAIKRRQRFKKWMKKLKRYRLDVLERHKLSRAANEGGSSSFSKHITIILVVSIFAIVLVLSLRMYLRHKFRRKRRLQRTEEREMLCYTNCEEHEDAISMGHLSVEGLLGSGRFGTVHAATLRKNAEADNPIEVKIAVKLFGDKSAFEKEKSIYDLLSMCEGNQFILKMITTQECTWKGRHHFGIVVELMELGTLRNYLTQNVLTWKQFFGFVLSVTNALAFLHQEFHDSNGFFKPVIIHRDLNTTNILLRDPTIGYSVVADFGVAYASRGVRASDHDSSAANCHGGTPLYMAPETLVRSLCNEENMHSLKRADVYSCALVLWELVSRCDPFYAVSGVDVPQHKLPYADEFDIKIFSQLIEHVVWKGTRPKFPVTDFLEKSSVHIHITRVIREMWESEPEDRIDIQRAFDAFRNLSEREGARPPFIDECRLH